MKNKGEIKMLPDGYKLKQPDISRIPTAEKVHHRISFGTEGKWF